MNAVKAIDHLRDSIIEGNNWISALLESMEMWSLPEEYYKDRYYRYVIGGEAFDWLVLAERLLIEVEDLIPKENTTELLFRGTIGADLTPNDFKRLLGSNKYSAYLNYWYGIVVEEALLRCIEQEEIKNINVMSTWIDGEQINHSIYTWRNLKLLMLIIYNYLYTSITNWLL